MEATRLADKVDFVLPFYNAIEDFEKENTILEKAVKKTSCNSRVWSAIL
jgi:hypothetical protein